MNVKAIKMVGFEIHLTAVTKSLFLPPECAWVIKHNRELGVRVFQHFILWSCALWVCRKCFLPFRLFAWKMWDYFLLRFLLWFLWLKQLMFLLRAHMGGLKHHFLMTYTSINNCSKAVLHEKSFLFVMLFTSSGM